MTLATVLLGMLKPVTAVVYVVAQFAGALLGFGLLKVGAPVVSKKQQQNYLFVSLGTGAARIL